MLGPHTTCEASLLHAATSSSLFEGGADGGVTFALSQRERGGENHRYGH